MAQIAGSWYKALLSPQDDTSPVGGAIDTSEPLAGLLGELFELGRSKFLGRGDYVRYRKVFFRNEGNEIADAVAYFSDLEHREQWAFAFAKSPTDESDDSETMPAGYTEADFFNPIGLIDASGTPDGSIDASGDIGFWVRQRIPEGLPAETGALAVLAIAGSVA